MNSGMKLPSRPIISTFFLSCSNASEPTVEQQAREEGGSQQDDQVAECQVESVNRDNNSIIHNSKPQQESTNSNGNANEPQQTVAGLAKQPPILRKVGEKTPPGTLKKSRLDRPTSSCKSWCQTYSQTFLAKTIDTPLPDPGLPSDEEEGWFVPHSHAFH